MARTAQQSAKKPARDIDQLVESLYAGVAEEGTAGPGIIRRTFEVIGDRVADSGDLFAELNAGFRAGRRNFHVQKTVALDRQKERTKQRLLALMAQ